MAMLALLRGAGVREPCRKHATRKALREVFKWGCDPTVTYAMRDPTFGVPYIRVETEGFHTWTVEDVLQYLNYHRPFSRAGRALGILLFTGAARCDVVNFGRQHVSNGRLKYRRDKTSVPIDVLPELQASIAATPVGNLTFIVTEFGRPFTPLGATRQACRTVPRMAFARRARPSRPMSREAKVARLALTHHDPLRTDDAIEE